ncbi:MAG: hypothetical protein WAU32_11160 [Thermoanaerobaculia bacterium]
MLRCKGIETAGPERCYFRVVDADLPASVESLERVARLADILLRENSLAGGFRAAGPGLLVLELSEGQRTYFHDGIVFAAIDAHNDHVKNPTLTLSADDIPPSG